MRRGSDTVCSLRWFHRKNGCCGVTGPLFDTDRFRAYSNGVISAIWAIIGLLLVLSEFAVPQFVVFFFGLGAILNAFLVLIVPGLASRIPLQILVWAFTSGVSLAFLRRYAARWFRGDEIREMEDRDAGRTASVLEEIRPDKPGRVTYHGTSWRAISYDETIGVGETVTILKKENLSLIVTAGDLLGESESDPKESL